MLEPASADAVVSPGLINPHDHITFANNWPIGDGVDRYEHRHDWRVGLNGHASLDTNGGASPETVLAAELRFVMGGATSTRVGSKASTSSRPTATRSRSTTPTAPSSRAAATTAPTTQIPLSLGGAATELEVTTKHPTRHPWAWLLQRVFAVDIMTCPLGVLGQSIWRARQYRENEAHVTLSSSATHE